MNYDINTTEGMANAVKWTERTMRALNDGGRWVIPRSGTTIIKVDGKSKTCVFEEGFASDLVIPKVLKAAGWTFVKKGGEQPDGCQ